MKTVQNKNKSQKTTIPILCLLALVIGFTNCQEWLAADQFSYSSLNFFSSGSIDFKPQEGGNKISEERRSVYIKSKIINEDTMAEFYKTLSKDGPIDRITEVDFKVKYNDFQARRFFEIDYTYRPTRSHEPIKDAYLGIRGSNIDGKSVKTVQRGVTIPA